MKSFFRGYGNILLRGDRKDKLAAWAVILLIILLLFNIFNSVTAEKARVVPTSEFLLELHNDNVKYMSICYKDGSVAGEFREVGEDIETNKFQCTVPELSNVLTQNYLDELKNSNKNKQDNEDYEVLEYNYNKPSELMSSIWSMLGFVVQIGLIIIIFAYIMKKQGTDLLPTKTKINKEIPNTGFEDVIGIPEAIEEVSEVVTFLKNPSKYNEAGAKFPKGILLQGPSGTGKTLLARSLAGEAGVPFIHASGSDFIEMFVGVGAKRVRELFDAAKESQPSILFIDEIDAVGGDRDSMAGGASEHLQTINALLAEMDGFDQNSSVVVIAATNRANALDKALLRPGRFDKIICVDNPAKEGRKEILQYYAQDRPFADFVDFDRLAAHTYGFSGAELENVMNQAATLAARRSAKEGSDPAITVEDLDEGISRTISGPAMKSKQMTMEEKRQTAYHEAGHAVVQYCLPHCDNVQKISIVSRNIPGVGQALGYVQSYSEEDTYIVNSDKCKDEIASFLAGRCSEKIHCNVESAGASDDLHKANELAYRMVDEFAFSNKRYHSYRVAIRDRNTKLMLNSDNRIREIENYINDILDEAAKKATKIIYHNRDKIEIIVKTLLKKETIDANEIKQIMESNHV